MNIKKNDIIIILIVIVLGLLVIKRNKPCTEGFISVDPTANVNNVNNMLAPIQSGLNELVNAVNTANATLKTIDYTKIPDQNAITAYASQKVVLNNAINSLADLNTKLPILSDEIFGNYDFSLLFDLFNRNYPSSFCIADKLSGNNLINLVNGSTISVTNPVNASGFKGVRSSTALPFIAGNVYTKVIWPTNNLKPSHTVVAITRYNGDAKGRILDSIDGNNNIAYGHVSGRGGVAYVNGQITKNVVLPSLPDNMQWLVSCIRATDSEPPANTNRISDAIMNNIKFGNGKVKPIHRNSSTLSINNRNNLSDGRANANNSGFALSAVIVFDSFLSDDDMSVISNVVNAAVKNPALLTNIENIFNTIKANKDANARITAGAASVQKASLNAASTVAASINRASTNTASTIAASVNKIAANNASVQRASLNAASAVAAGSVKNAASVNRASIIAASAISASTNKASTNGANAVKSAAALANKASVDALNAATNASKLAVASNNAVAMASAKKASTDAANAIASAANANKLANASTAAASTAAINAAKSANAASANAIVAASNAVKASVTNASVNNASANRASVNAGANAVRNASLATASANRESINASVNAVRNASLAAASANRESINASVNAVRNASLAAASANRASVNAGTNAVRNASLGAASTNTANKNASLAAASANKASLNTASQITASLNTASRNAIIKASQNAAAGSVAK